MAKPSQQISPQQWDEWARNPITRAFVETLEESVEATKETWACQGYVGENAESTLAKMGYALSGIERMREIIQAVENCKLEGNSHE